MNNIDFKAICNGIHHTACVVSIEKKEGGPGEIRIVDGNDSYLASFKGEGYTNHTFVPDSIYTDYLAKNLNFEDYCYRSAGDILPPPLISLKWGFLLIYVKGT